MSRYYDSKGSFRRARSREEVDPMSSMGNMGDVMLVFACGLMTALVVAWNVDLAQFQQVETDQELSQDQVSEITEQMYGEGNGFVEKGRVYQDPQTGQYYLVEDEESSSGSSSSSDEDEDSDS